MIAKHECPGMEWIHGPAREIVGVEPQKVSISIDGKNQVKVLECQFLVNGDCHRPELDANMPVNTERSSFRVTCRYTYQNKNYSWERDGEMVNSVWNVEPVKEKKKRTLLTGNN
jgi:hypothetical protein